MNLFDELDNIDPTPTTYAPDEVLLKVTPITVTLGCMLGHVMPDMPEIPLADAVQTCHRIAKEIEAWG